MARVEPTDTGLGGDEPRTRESRNGTGRAATLRRSASRDFWNRWNAEFREDGQGDVSQRQAEVVTGWLDSRSGLSLLDAGCGSGWMCAQLRPFGEVVGTDLADEVVARAGERLPDVRFVAGDIMTVDVGGDFDVVVSLEVLTHLADQYAFVRRVNRWLVPGGELLLATQNRPVLTHFNRIPPPSPGQLRRWIDRTELRTIATAAGFQVEEIRTVSPIADHGIMRVVAKLGRMTGTTRVLERLGFGWTIMLRATKISEAIETA